MAFGDIIAETVLGKPTAPEDTNNAPNVVAEGAAVNTTVGITAHSSFANGDASLDYFLSADSSGGGFKIDQSTGVVTVADPSKIDFESAPGHAYTITVFATKNNNFSSQQTFTISVNDVAPSTPVDSNPAANTVLEGAAAGTSTGITASASDVNGGAVTWSLTGDTSGGGFTINAATGVITVADGSKIDYESSPGHAYTVTATASDGTLSSSQSFTINVGDVAMTTPVDSNAAANTVAEGAAAGTTVGITASATDPSGPATTYSLIGDTSGGGFAINASTGVVTVANPAKIDFESTAPGHTYNITVQASNGVQTTQQTFAVGVTDVAPSAPSDGNPAANSVAEGAAIGTLVGVTVSSSDVNGGAVTYSLIGDTSSGGFTINSTTGVITVANSAKIDFESAPAHAYTVTAQASDGTLTSSQNFSIAVTDVAPSAPGDANGATNTIAEGAANGSTVGITASSTDVNGPGVTYSLTGDTSGGGFTINATTGVVSVADSTKIDFETSGAGHSYTVTAQASDGTLTNSQTFSIAVTDVAPSTPTDVNAATNTIAEGAANGSIVGITASSTDPNGPAVTYSLTDNAGGRFAINSSTGVVSVANGAAIDFETAPSHAYSITVQGTSGALSTTQTFSIGVTDVGPSTPGDSDGATNAVFEGAANGTLVGITASSSDPGGGPAPTFSLTDSAGGRFTINSTTGVVSVANGAAIDFETAPSHAYGITVQATAGALSSTQNFSIGVGNVNEAPSGADKTVTTLEDNNYVFSVADFGFSDPSDSSAPNTLQAVKIATIPGGGVLTNNGVAVSAGQFVSATDIAAGHLVFAPAANANGVPEASFTFQVQDNGGTANGGVDTDQSPNTITINVTPVNDAPTATNLTQTLTINEDAPATTLFTVAPSVSDVDSPNLTATLTLNAATGVLNGAGTGSLSGGILTYTITGTQAAVNSALAGVTYDSAQDFHGSASVGVTISDGANGPQGTNPTGTVSITVNSVNDAPAGTDNTVTTLEGNNYVFSVGDFGFSDTSDSPANALQAVKITTIPGGGVLTNNGVAVNPNDFVSAADIAAGHLVFAPTAHANGSPEASFTFQVQDNGGTANGGFDTDQSPNTMSINVSAVNDAPINSVPGAQSVNEDSSLVFSAANGNAITISDIDVGSGNETVTLTVANGTLALGSTLNLASFTNNAASITLTGTVANVNAAMDGLTYHGNLNFNGSDPLTVFTSDNGNTGTGGVKTDTDSVAINVAAVNDAPVNGVPGTQTVNEDTDLVFTGANAISISDVDANGNNETVTLSVASGALTLNGTAGLSFTVGDGTADSTMTFSGTVAAINTALNGLIYRGNLNFNGPDSLSITTNDNGNTGSGGALSDTDSFTINVTAVNDAPVVTAGHVLNYTENQVATAIDPAITVSDVDNANLSSATVQITGNYVNGEDVLGFANTATITGSFDAASGTLTLTGSDTVAHYQAALASVTYANTSDNPSGAARTVTITANDGSANSTAVTDTINVTPVNDAPVVTAGHTLNYTENQGPAVLDAAIAVSDVDSANLVSATLQITGNYVAGEDALGFTDTANITGSFDSATGTLTLTGSDTVANYQAALASVAYLNTSENPSGLARTVTIITNDGAANSTAVTDTINVTPVNDAPVATAGHTLAYTENDPATALDTAFTVSDVDNANLSSASVQITGNYVNGQDVLAFANTATITGSFDAATGTLTLTGSDTVANYQAALRSVTYVNSSEDPSGASRTVTILTSDGAASSAAVTDTITVQPVNDAPTLTATGNNPNYANGVDLFSGVTASTVEAGQSLDQLKLTVTNISGTAADSLSIDGTPVALTDGNVVSTSTPGVTATVAVSGSTATVTIDSTPGLSNAAMAALVDGLSYTDTSVTPGDPARVVTITQLHDTGGTTPGVDTAVLSITSTVFFDQAPVVTAGHTLNYTENQAATAFDPAITVTDADTANLTSAKVQITGNYVNGEDVLAFANTASITGSFDASTGTLTLTGSDTVAHYQTALRTVTYVNTSDNPSGAARTVTITANDGLVNSVAATDTINVSPVNDAPVVTAGHTLNYTENQAPTAFDPAITVTDVDNTNLASATVQITANYVNGEDVLAFSNTATITGTFDAVTGKLTLTGSDTVANYQAALASVTYANSSENPSGLARTVTIVANDGAANSVAKTDTINVTPVNDAPVTTAGGTLNYTENQAAAVIDSSVTVTDVDNANMASATVQITSGFAAGQDVLSANTAGTSITASFVGDTLTLSGSDTKAHYQQVLDSVRYFNSSDNPSGADRTVSYTVNDGTVNSNTSTATVHVTPVNDAPVVTATGTLAYTEDQGPAAIASALTVSDVDTTTLSSASVVISANYVNGEDVLAFSNTANITGSFDAATGTMTLTGTDTVANYQAALRTVTYTDTSENPSTAARTVTFKADDGQSANHLSAGSNHTITVASVDDAPTVTVPGAQDPVSAHTDYAIAGVSTADVDAGAGPIKTSLATTHGNITVTLSGGATLADATVNGSHSVHIQGTPTDVNATLASIVYHGDVGFTGADALTVQTNDLGHTGTGGPLSSSVGTVNIGVIPKVWFIDNSASAVGADGSQAHPFNTIAAFNAINDGGANHAQTGDYIYLKTGTGIYSETDGIHLLNNQQLVGGGDGLSFTDPLNNANTITLATAGTRPVIDVTGGAGNDAIHLAQDNTIHGFNVATESAAAMGIVDNGGTVGTLTISNMDVGVDPDGAGALSGNLGQAISITHGGTGGSMTFGTVSSGGGASGIALGGALVTSFSATGGTLSGHTGAEFSSSGGSGNISYGGAVGDGSGNTSVSITGRTGGTVTLSGNITDGSDTGGGIGVSGNANTTINFTGSSKALDTVIGDGVSITNNTGSTVNFTNGGLVVQTTNGTGLLDTVAGTLNISGSGNTITTTGTGGIVNLDSVSLGASGVTFGSLQSTGASVGTTAVLLNNVDGSGNTFSGGTVSIAGTAAGAGATTTAGAGNDGIRVSGGSTATFNFGSTTIGTTGDDGIELSGANGAVTFSSVAINGSGGDGIEISGNTNAVNINGAGSTIGNTNDPTGDGVRVSGGSADITVAASITKTTAGHVVDVSGHTGGTIGFSGAISGTGAVDDGISLTTNTGTTMNFSGGMTLTTGAGNGFAATGGGTVNVTNGANNHIVTASGTALNISNTTIGGSGATFHDISANGGTNGIILVNTGGGAFTVTGDGTNTAQGGNNTGGIIQNLTGADGTTQLNGAGNGVGAGIYLSNASNVTIQRMNIHDASNFGVDVEGSSNFVMKYTTVSGANGNSSGQEESSVRLLELAGTNTLDNNDISGGFTDNIRLDNHTASLTDLDITNNKIHDNNATTGNQGILVDFVTGAAQSIHITGNTFFHNRAESVDIGASGGATSSSAVINATVTNNTFTGNRSTDLGGGFEIQTANFNGHLLYDISGNTLQPVISGSNFAVNQGSAIQVSAAGAAGSLVEGRINNNKIGTTGVAFSGTQQGSGITVDNTGSGTTTTLITNNDVQHFGNTGIAMTVGGSGLTTGTFNATITGNTVHNTDATAAGSGTPNGINGNFGTNTNNAETINLDISGNTLGGSGSNDAIGAEDFRLRQRMNTDVFIKGYGGGSGVNDTASVVSYIQSVNTGSETGTATVSLASPPHGFHGLGSVPQPTLPPPLRAAAGGVQASSPTPGETHLSQAQLDSVVAAAIAQWAHAGASAAQLAALAAITFTVNDLSGDIIGEQTPGHITIDINAAGHGWFVDPTPNDNSEFTHAQNAQGTDLLTDPSNAAAGHLDLLTAVTHEMGHVLGLDDETAASSSHDLMFIDLVDGERRLPDATDVVQADASKAVDAAEAALPVSAQAAAGTPIIVGTSGNDTIDAGRGGAILFGGAGADNFVFGPATPLDAPTPTQITHVVDYHEAQGDTFDFSAITSVFHNSSVSDSLVVRAVEDASGKFATLQVDHIDPIGLPSAPNWVNVAQLDGAHAGDAVNVLIDSHSTLHLAQIHVDLLA
jgi:hypothetical protein